MSLTEEERKVLKREFEVIAPSGVHTDIEGDRCIYSDWNSQWETFKEGYLLGKKTKGNLT